MNRFKRHKLWIITVLLSAPVIVVAAVPNVFQPGTVISAATMNANFAALDGRVAALETAIANSGAQVVMSNVAGPLPKSMAFPSKGGPLLLIVSGTAWHTPAGGTISVTVQLDAVTVGNLLGFTNEPSSHKALPTRVFRVAPAAGQHTLVLLADTGTTTDATDNYSVTVVELAH